MVEVELESAELFAVLVGPGEVDEVASVAVVLDSVALPDEFAFAVGGFIDFDLPGVGFAGDVAEFFVDEGDLDGEVVEVGWGLVDGDGEEHSGYFIEQIHSVVAELKARVLGNRCLSGPLPSQG